MPVKLNGATSGSVTIDAPAVAGTNTLTLPAATGTIIYGTQPSGTIVGTTDTQTLTNKTLTSPTVTGAVVSAMASSVLTSETAKASTSGTSIDFTGIPSWVKRITVMFSGVSTNGTNPIFLQIGSGSFSTSGYLGSAIEIDGSPLGVLFTSGFGISPLPAVADIFYGIMTIVNITGTTWVSSFVGSRSNAAFSVTGNGSSGSIGGPLDRLRILASATGSPSDTFDAGTINIMYE